MICHAAENKNDEVFSWKQFRAERRKTEKKKHDKKSRKSGKSKASKKDEKLKQWQTFADEINKENNDNIKIVEENMSLDNNSSLHYLESSEATLPTMAESLSTFGSLQKSSSLSSVDDHNLQDNVLDHIVLAAPDLEEAIAEFYKKTGVEPIKVGHINGMGIVKARVAFEGSSFLEIIAPDPNPERPGPIGELLKSCGLTKLVPFHWAIRKVDAQDLCSKVKRMGYAPDFIQMKGPNKDGECKQWETLYLYDNTLNGMCPFFIDWCTFDHPCDSETMPVVGNLIDVTISAPKDDKLHELFQETKAEGFTLEIGSSHFEVKFDSPKGEISFVADSMIGFKIPGFDDTQNDVKEEENKASS